MTDIKKIIRSHRKGVEIDVLVLPRSSRSEITGLHDGAVKIKITNPPVDGQANKECCNILKKFFNVSNTRIRILKGSSSRQKTILVEDVTVAEVSARFESL